MRSMGFSARYDLRPIISPLQFAQDLYKNCDESGQIKRSRKLTNTDSHQPDPFRNRVMQ